jgi:hypothetical protein
MVMSSVKLAWIRNHQKQSLRLGYLCTRHAKPIAGRDTLQRWLKTKHVIAIVATIADEHDVFISGVAALLAA